jgi:hypothetical protein
MDRRRIQVSVDCGSARPEIVGRQAVLIRPDGAGVGELRLASPRRGRLDARSARRPAGLSRGTSVERLKVDRALRLHLGALGAGADLELKPGEDDAGRFQTADFGSVAKAARARAGRRHAIEADTMRIGRDPDSDLVVDDLIVSRRHAELQRRADGLIHGVRAA